MDTKEIKLKAFQQKQVDQLNNQFIALCNSNNHKNKKDWSLAKRGQAKAKIVFLVNQAVRQRWTSLPTNKTIAVFAGCQIRWVKKVINKFLGIREWLKKMSKNVRQIARFKIHKKIDIKETMLKLVFGYVNPHKQLIEYIE